MSNALYNIHHYNIDDKKREIYLHDYFDETTDGGISYRTATTFIKNLNFLDSQSDLPIVVHMFSDGGDVVYGMSIYDAIKSSRSRTCIIAYGHAASMSSIILQAADLRILQENTTVLLHNGTYGYSEVTMKHIMKEVDWMKKSVDTMLNIYANRAKDALRFKNKSLSDVKKYFATGLERNQEWYMTPKEAIDRGLADHILGETIEYKDVHRAFSAK